MGCASCGGNNNVKKKPPYVNQFNQNNFIPMKAYIEQLGWRFIGMCGCRDNKSMFVNDIIVGWQIHISPAGNRMGILQMFGPDGKERHVAGGYNYQHVYQYWLGTKDKIKIIE